MSDPAWLVSARKLVGLKEIVGSKHEPKVVAFFAAAGNPGIKDDETAWCAAFVGAMLAQAGVKGTGLLNARSYLDWGTKLSTPRVGCVVVFQRANSSWQGHVAFFLRLVGNRIEVLGGNQGNAVSVASYPKDNLLGYRWPSQLADPAEVVPTAPPIEVEKLPKPAKVVVAPQLSNLGAAAPSYGEAEYKNVQARLIALGYTEVGEVDGNPATKTDAAILAFRNDNGLPAGTEIDPDLLVTLMVAKPRKIAAERANATVADLREKGSSIIKETDLQKIGGGIAAGGLAIKGAKDSGVIDALTGAGDKVTEITEKLTPFQTVLQIFSDWIWLPILIIVGVVVWQAIKIARARLRDHQTGNTSVVNLPPTKAEGGG